jgi:hypothetical protein
VDPAVVLWPREFRNLCWDRSQQRVDPRFDRRHDQLREALWLAADQPPRDQGFEGGRGSVGSDVAATPTAAADAGVAGAADDVEFVLAQRLGLEQLAEQLGLGLGVDDPRAFCRGGRWDSPRADSGGV